MCARSWTEVVEAWKRGKRGSDMLTYTIAVWCHSCSVSVIIGGCIQPHGTKIGSPLTLHHSGYKDRIFRFQVMIAY